MWFLKGLDLPSTLIIYLAAPVIGLYIQIQTELVLLLQPWCVYFHMAFPLPKWHLGLSVCTLVDSWILNFNSLSNAFSCYPISQMLCTMSSLQLLYPMSIWTVAVFISFAVIYFDISPANQQTSEKLSPCPIHSLIHIFRTHLHLLHEGSAHYKYQY